MVASFNNQDMKRRILLAAALLLAVTGLVRAEENPVIITFSSDAVIPQGGTGEMKVYYQATGDNQFKAFQIDVPLPTGITIKNVEMKLFPSATITEGDFSILKTDNTYDPKSKFFATYNNNSNKSVVIGFQTGNVTFPATSSEPTLLCTLTLKAEESVETNYVGYPVTTDYIEVTDANTELKKSANQEFPIKVFKKGDVNMDGKVNIADVVCIINYSHGLTNENFDKSMANVNQDDIINIADVQAIINILHSDSDTPSSQQAPKYEEIMLDPQ